MYSYEISAAAVVALLLYAISLPFMVRLCLYIGLVSVLQKMLYRVLFREKVDWQRTVSELISSRGFKAETHTVIGKDGYSIVIHRVINPLIDLKVLETKPILLMHGLAANSSHWIINSEKGRLTKGSQSINKNGVDGSLVDDSLAFTLSNLGYDVWMPNMRGNKFSLGHKTLDSQKDSKYWDFSFDEVVENDVPVFIDYILRKTKQKQLSYVGVSMGSTLLLGLLSDKAEYNAKIKEFIAMAPALRFNHSNVLFPKPIAALILYPLEYFFTKYPGPVFPAILPKLIKYFACGNFISNDENNWKFMKRIKIISVRMLMNLIGGYHVNIKRNEVISAYAGLHVSRRMAAHLVQMHYGSKFQKFDFGREKNLRVYGQGVPLQYNLTNVINENISVIYSEDDSLIPPPDIFFAVNSLIVPVVEMYKVPTEKWQHFDFKLGKDCGKIVNAKIVEMLIREKENANTRL